MYVYSMMITHYVISARWSSGHVYNMPKLAPLLLLQNCTHRFILGRPSIVLVLQWRRVANNKMQMDFFRASTHWAVHISMKSTAPKSDFVVDSDCTLSEESVSSTNGKIIYPKEN